MQYAEIKHVYSETSQTGTAAGSEQPYWSDKIMFSLTAAFVRNANPQLARDFALVSFVLLLFKTMHFKILIKHFHSRFENVASDG